MYLSIIFLNVNGKLFKEQSIGIYESTASFAGTRDFFKHFNFVNNVVVQARLAKVKLVFKIAHEHHIVIFFHLFLADLAAFDVKERVYFFKDNPAKFRLF